MKSFQEYLAGDGNKHREFTLEMNLTSDVVPYIKQNYHLFVGESSKDFFYMFGESQIKQVEKFCGLSLKDAIKHIDSVENEQEDAYIMGMSNVVGINKIYQWHNGTRIFGNQRKYGKINSMAEEIAHESVHTARLLMNRQYYQDKNQLNLWLEKPWLCIGDDEGMIDEGSFAAVVGGILRQITETYQEFLGEYI